MKKKRGFTLIELLAVIVVLAVILIIAVPKISEIIDNSKLGTITSSAKIILNAAEKKKTENQVLENVEELTCNKVTNLNDTDYQSCELTFNNNIPYIVLIGKGKLKGYKCEGTKDNLNCRKVVNTNLIIDLDGGTGNNQSGIYNVGETIILEIPEKNGYELARWEMLGGNSVLNGNELTIGTEETSVKAVWDKKEITYNMLSNNYSCANKSVGTEYLFTYTGNCEIVSNGENGWKIKYLSSGTLTLSSEFGVDLFLVGGGGGGSSSAGGGGGYTKTYLNQVIEAGTYNMQVGAQVTSGNSGNKSYFGDESKYVAFGGNVGGNGNGGSGGSGGGGRGGTCCVSYDGNQGVCSSASETSGGSGGKFGSNGSAGGSCSMNWGPGAGSGGSGQGNTTCEFDEGTTSGCMAGVKSYSSGGHGKSGSSVSANTGNGGGRNSAGSSGIIIMRSTSITNVVVNDEVIGTYNGKVNVVESEGDYKITFYTSGSFILNKSLNVDLFLVGGGGGGNSGGGGGGYTKTYLNKTIEAGTYEIKIGNGGNVSSNGGITYFGTKETYFANGGNASSSYSGGSGGSGGGGRGGTCCVSYDANQGVCSSASETSGGSGGTFGSNGSAGGSCSMNWGPGAGSGGSGQGNTTCEFGEGTTSGCNSGITSYSKGGPGYVSSAIMNSGNGGGRNSAGASGILIIRNAR